MPDPLIAVCRPGNHGNKDPRRVSVRMEGMMAAREQLNSTRGTVCTRLRMVRCPHSQRSLLPPDTSQVRNSSDFGLLPDPSSVSITLSFRSSPPFNTVFATKYLRHIKV